MGLNRKVLGGIKRISCALMLSFVLTFSALTAAFGELTADTNQKVLGVGRIQSTVSEIPVATEGRFAFAAESTLGQTSGLAAPITREAAPVIIAQPVYVAPDPVVSGPGDGWKSTMATNYGTPGDGFIYCTTAYGTTTTETSMGVAHKSIKLGTVIEIYCPKTGLSCIATVDDRGPYGGYWGQQPDSLDLQMGVTAALGNNYGWYEVWYRVIYTP